MLATLLHFAVNQSVTLGAGVGSYLGASAALNRMVASDRESILARRVEDDPMGARLGLLSFAALGMGYMGYHQFMAGGPFAGARRALTSMGRTAYDIGRGAGQATWQFGRGLYSAVFRDRSGQLVPPGKLLTAPEEYLPRLKALVIGATAFKMGLDVLSHENRLARAYAREMDWRQARAPLDFALGVDGDIVLASYYNARSVWETAVT